MGLRTVLCISTIFIQTITAQSYERFITNAPCANAANTNQAPAYIKTIDISENCPVTITYSSPISPSGLSLLSDLSMQGQLGVTGSMPFIAAVQMEGSVPSTGQATASYGCGIGDTVLITQESGNPCGANANVPSGLTLAKLTLLRH